MPTIVLLASVLALLVPDPARAQPRPSALRLAGIQLRLDLDYPRKWLIGEASLLIENTSAYPSDQVPLQTGRLMKVTRVIGADGQGLPFTQEIVAYADWTLRQVNAVQVRLPRAVAPGDSVTMTVSYEGHLVGATETGMLYVRDQLEPAFTVLREEAFAFPVVGEPSLAAMRAVPRGQFSFSAEVSVPDTLVVATGSEMVGRQVAEGRATYSFRSRRSVPFLNLTVAPYRLFERDGVRAWVLPADSARGPDLLGVVSRSLAWFTERFGDLPLRPDLSLIEIPDGWGSQAQLDAGIMIEAAALRRVEDRRSLYHEISHLWNAPDEETPSPRWNEGLATWLEHRVAAELDGADAEAAMAAMAVSVCRRVAASSALRATPLAAYGSANLTGSSYSVGALFFHVLHGVLGSDKFDQTYRMSWREGASRSSISLDRLEASFTGADPRARAVFSDWVRTTAWQGRLCPTADLAAVIRHYGVGQRA